MSMSGHSATNPAPKPAKIFPARFDDRPVMVMAPNTTAVTMAAPAAEAINSPGEAKPSADKSIQKCVAIGSGSRGITDNAHATAAIVIASGSASIPAVKRRRAAVRSVMVMSKIARGAPGRRKAGHPGPLDSPK